MIAKQTEGVQVWSLEISKRCTISRSDGKSATRL